jgi:hypothetical protein
MKPEIEVPIRYSIPPEAREYRYTYDLNIEGYADKWKDAITEVMLDQTYECPTLHEFWMNVRDVYFLLGGQYVKDEDIPFSIEYED